MCIWVKLFSLSIFLLASLEMNRDELVALLKESNEQILDQVDKKLDILKRSLQKD